MSEKISYCRAMYMCVHIAGEMTKSNRLAGEYADAGMQVAREAGIRSVELYHSMMETKVRKRGIVVVNCNAINIKNALLIILNIHDTCIFCWFRTGRSILWMAYTSVPLELGFCLTTSGRTLRRSPETCLSF